MHWHNDDEECCSCNQCTGTGRRRERTRRRRVYAVSVSPSTPLEVGAWYRLYNGLNLVSNHCCLHGATFVVETGHSSQELREVLHDTGVLSKADSILVLELAGGGQFNVPPWAGADDVA
jgi:hypothetical protein